VIRYTTKPEHAEENARLIRDVFAELGATRPAGLCCDAYRLDDGVSFMHVVDVEGPDHPLAAMASFAAFPAGSANGAATARPRPAAVVGSYSSDTWRAPQTPRQVAHATGRVG